MSSEEQTDDMDNHAHSAPRQGFESEANGAGGPVKPPGAGELAMSAVELVGDLAKAGLSASERVLKDALSRIPRP